MIDIHQERHQGNVKARHHTCILGNDNSDILLLVVTKQIYLPQPNVQILDWIVRKQTVHWIVWLRTTSSRHDGAATFLHFCSVGANDETATPVASVGCNNNHFSASSTIKHLLVCHTMAGQGRMPPGISSITTRQRHCSFCCQ